MQIIMKIKNKITSNKNQPKRKNPNDFNSVKSFKLI